jgi:hypothetical protein
MHPILSKRHTAAHGWSLRAEERQQLLHYERADALQLATVGLSQRTSESVRMKERTPRI